MRQGVLWINNGFCFPSLLYPLPSRVGMGQGQRYWHDREMGSFIYLRGEIPVSVLPAHEAAVHAERKEAFHSLPAHVLPASGSSRATGETLGELGWGLPYQVTPGPFSCWLLLAWLFLFFFFSFFLFFFGFFLNTPREAQFSEAWSIYLFTYLSIYLLIHSSKNLIEH